MRMSLLPKENSLPSVRGSDLVLPLVSLKALVSHIERLEGQTHAHNLPSESKRDPVVPLTNNTPSPSHVLCFRACGTLLQTD